MKSKHETMQSFIDKNKFSSCIPGIILTALIAILAHFLGQAFPILGGAVIAILLGVIIKQTVGVPSLFSKGISFTLKKLLKAAIVLLGFGYSFIEIYSLGLNALIIVIIAVLTGIFLTYFLGRLFKLEGNIPLLISLGTGICGATAIATSGPIIKAKEEEIVYAVNTIFAFNVLAVLVYPLIGHLLSMTDHAFGVWAGIAIHDTSSVVAAGYNYSAAAGDTSVVFKLIRTLMLVPVAVILSVMITMKTKASAVGSDKVKISKVFPYFILVFAGAAALNTIVPLPGAAVEATSIVAKYIILMVMASVGLGTDIGKIKSVGLRPLIVGLLSSILMGAVTFLLVGVFY
ncbi:YeiH family protein [Bacillus sp. EB01]|uniref:YeiH family protein n=1 Tax=Bacillus sp. EB01 TaxID=1347086 RepID=UPI0009DFBAFF|nr:YeiH family protein [Bacillus sp. EB01]